MQFLRQSLVSWKVCSVIAVLMMLMVVSPAHSADVSLAADDGMGSTSFNTAQNWSDGLAPSSGNNYFTGDYRLRTPPDGGSYTFAGDSLTVNNTNGYSWGLMYKGTGTSGVLTIDNLILDGGMISHANGTGDLCQLDGTITVASDSTIYAKQGNIDILADLTGTGNLIIPTTDDSGSDNRYVSFFGSNSDYRGSLEVAGRMRLEESGGLTFAIGADGVNNGVTGSGKAVFNGTFSFDLTNAGANDGDSWMVISVGTKSFGEAFSVTGFSEPLPGVWSRRGYYFYESTGMLSYGESITLTALPLTTLTDGVNVPNGAWSWFEDERCIVDAGAPDGPRLIVGTVSSAPDGDAESGDIDVTWLDLVNGDKGHFELANRLQRDDHDSAALWVRPDGRYLAVYCKHTADLLTRWRVSTNPHDPTSWDSEQTLVNGSNTTYSNLHYLPDDNGGAGRLYNFTRAINWDPTILTSDDYGSTWSGIGKLMTMGGTSDRPYVRYYSNGDCIHFITTEEHPRDFDNSIYHGYVKDGVSYGSDGAVIDDNVFDAFGVTPTSYTRVMSAGDVFGGDSMHNAWTIDVAIDDGNPVILFIARANALNTDHRFFYGRYAADSGWTVYEIAEAGAYLYSNESDYTGLGSIDPDDPDVLVLSTRIDPRSGRSTPHYEIYQGRTSDGGATWAWIPLTGNSDVDNLRPLIPSFRDGFERVMVWMRGSYSSYTSWTTDAVVMREEVLDRVNWECMSGPNNTVRPSECSAAQFSMLDRDGDDDVDLQDVATFLAEHQELNGVE